MGPGARHDARLPSRARHSRPADFLGRRHSPEGLRRPFGSVRPGSDPGSSPRCRGPGCGRTGAAHSEVTGEWPRRRPGYRRTHPRAFAEKYKEREPERYAETAAQVEASGKTPAGSHRPIMVGEVREALAPRPGEVAVDATLGYGGHAAALLPRLVPGGRLVALDVDPIERPRTEGPLGGLGF